MNQRWQKHSLRPNDSDAAGMELQHCASVAELESHREAARAIQVG
jgi:hypothetical protein